MASILDWLRRVGWAGALSIAIGCGDDGSSGSGGAGAGGSSLGGAPTGGAPGTGGAGGAEGGGGKSPELEAVETLVFSGCSGFGAMTCHVPNGHGELGGDLDLSPGHAWAGLVNRPATQSPGKTLVIPSDVEGSFLWQKLNNQLGPDEGDPMPKGEGIQWSLPPEEQLDAVRTWIEAGAPD